MVFWVLVHSGKLASALYCRIHVLARASAIVSLLSGEDSFKDAISAFEPFPGEAGIRDDAMSVTRESD